MSTKTKQILRMLEEGKTVKEIKEAGVGSEALIYRVKAKYDAEKNIDESTVPEEEEEEPTDEEIEAAIKQIKIKPEDKYLNKTPQAQEEDYRCMGCKHEWKASSIPLKCPNCGSEF